MRLSFNYRAKNRFFPIAYNESEAVLFRFFDALRHPIEEWEIRENGAAITQTFHSVRVDWSGADPVRVTFERNVEIDVENYDHLALCVQALETTTAPSAPGSTASCGL